MKRRSFLPLLIIALLFNSSAIACVNLMDTYSAGVMFNNNELISLNYFDSLGKEGTHFFRSCIATTPDSSVKDVVILTPEVDPLNWNDFFSIKNVSVTNSLLEIEVRYGGGCKTHEFILYADPILKDGNPPVLNFILLHNANEDACKALITETLVFNIKSIEELHQGVSPISIHINNRFAGIKWYLDNTCIIKYRSHFSPDVMVYLEYTPMEMEESQVFPSMRIITNPEVKYANGFDYAKAVAVELQWLLNNKVINGISEQTISRIEQSIISNQGQFWTLQDSLLAYNALFPLTIDTTGEWIWGDAIITKRNGCSSTLEFTLPTDSLNNGSTPVKMNQVISARRNFTIKAAGSGFTIDFYQHLNSPAHLEILDLGGRLLHRVSVPVNQNSFVIQTSNRLSRGIYQFILRSKEVTQTRTLVVTD